MPIKDKDIGFDKKLVKVSKNGLDPFAAKQQALNLVRRELPAPMPPNAGDIEYDVHDRGDYYEVTVQAKERRAGPKGLARARGMIGRGAQDKGQGQGPPDNLSIPFDGADEMLSVDEPWGPRDSFDLQGQLNSLYSALELRDIARQNGVYVPNTMDKRRLVTAIMDRDPHLARQLADR